MSLADFKNLKDLLQSTTLRKEEKLTKKEIAEGKEPQKGKEDYLRLYEHNETCREILHFLFNPYIVTGLSDKKVNQSKKNQIGQIGFFSSPIADINELLHYFKTHNTGRDEDAKMLTDFLEGTSHPDLVTSIIKKDLKLGVDAKTLNKVYGEGFVPTFDIMLAEKFDDFADYVEDKTFIITEKLDGVRCVLFFENGCPQFFSRLGQPISKLVELEKQAQLLDKNFVYDGELLLRNDQHLPSEDLYRKTVTVTSSDNEKKNVIFHLFDKISKEDFMKGFSEVPAIQRKTDLHGELSKLNGAPNLKEAEMLYVGKDLLKIEQFLNEYIAMQKEGIMLNIADAPYESKRTKNLLKVKKFHTADVLVKELIEGEGALVGKLGAVMVEFNVNGKSYTCKVGSGFKEEERDFFWNNQKEIKGKIIEIGYFNITKNQKNSDYSLRFPTFKHLRPDKTEISMY